MSGINSPDECHRKLIPLQWNEFPITRTWKDIVLEFDVTVTTRRLSLNYIADDRTQRHDLILDLFEQGKKDKEIAEILNAMKITTPKGGQYYSDLVFATRRKLRLRKERETEMAIQFGSANLYLNESR
jgi:hypothetical protein